MDDGLRVWKDFLERMKLVSKRLFVAEEWLDSEIWWIKKEDGRIRQFFKGYETSLERIIRG